MFRNVNVRSTSPARSEMSVRQNISGSSPFEPLIGFSRAVRIGNTVHVSGTGPVGADEGSVEEQTRRVFEIIEQALTKAGGALRDIVGHVCI